jgi:hypothetical protein
LDEVVQNEWSSRLKRRKRQAAALYCGARNNFGEKTQMFGHFVEFKEIGQSGGDFALPYGQFDVGRTTDNQTDLYGLSHDLRGVRFSDHC